MSATRDDGGFPAGLSHVVTSSANGTNRKFHVPADGQPDEPACDAQLHADRAEWTRRDHPRQVIFMTRCGKCSWPDDGGSR